MDARVIHEERQSFSPWVYLIIVALLVGASVNLWFVMNASGNMWPLLYAALVAIAVIPVLVNLLQLVIQVYPDHVYARLGAIVPIFWARIPIADIQAVRIVQYRPLRDAGGWGLRFGRFEGKSCRFFNARGNRGVLIDTLYRRYIIGSQEPEQLAAALETARARIG